MKPTSTRADGAPAPAGHPAKPCLRSYTAELADVDPWARWNLTAALVLVAAMELVVNRLANRLFLPRSLVTGASAGATVLARAVSDSGPFLFHLTGVLAVLIFAMALGGLLRRRELFPSRSPRAWSSA